MGEVYYVVSRPAAGPTREYFVGIISGVEVATSPVLFDAWSFADEAEAQECADVLARNDLLGFTVSRCGPVQESRNLRRKGVSHG